jgi:fatty-acyl-CoA synthase
MNQAVPEFDAPMTVCAQIEARATHPATENKAYLLQGDRSWSYRRYRDESVRHARFLVGRLGACDEGRPGHVAMLLENHFELLALYGGCAFSGSTLFGVNTGLRGEILAGVLNQSQARVLIVDERFLPEVEKVAAKLDHLDPENLLVYRGADSDVPADRDWLARIDDEVGGDGVSLDAPSVDVKPDTNLMVIYTSGTTGLPKGINNNHFKLLATGVGISRAAEMGFDDVGYTCMPLFHSNSMFVGVSPNFWVGGSVAIRERFSASGFLPDILKHGVTGWNYVGEPVHYVLNAIEAEFGGDEDRIRSEITENPQNRMRFAVGNGASPPDIDRFMRWFGLEEMYELYGSTEAAISTFRKKGDPRGSVGEITDEAVKILDEDGNECPPAELAADGKIANYARAVGEICRSADDTSLFQGYFDNADATQSKYRDGIYHSGDLGHVLLQDGRRYLFFDGRTDDWIRKDGENFSAAQVARIVQNHTDVDLAAAYGVPCTVSDELVMVALKLAPGASFDPQAFFEWCDTQCAEGGMDRKWFPDFVRVVDDFTFTQTQKILVRELKSDHFHRDRLPGAPLFWRERGDAAFRPFGADDFAQLRERFRAAERDALLDV